jgi:hypothetical protein
MPACRRQAVLNTASIGKGTHCTLWEQWTPAFAGVTMRVFWFLFLCIVCHAVLDTAASLLSFPACESLVICVVSLRHANPSDSTYNNATLA